MTLIQIFLLMVSLQLGTAWGPNGGNSPYLDASDNTNYIFETSGDLDDMAWFTFADTTATGSGITTHLWVEFDKAGGEKLNWYIDTTGDNTTRV